MLAEVTAYLSYSGPGETDSAGGAEVPARKHFSPWRPAPAPAPAPAGTGGRGGAAGGPQGCPLTLSVQPPGPDPPSRVAGVAAQTFLVAQSRDSSPITGHGREKSSSLGWVCVTLVSAAFLESWSLTAGPFLGSVTLSLSLTFLEHRELDFPT